MATESDTPDTGVLTTLVVVGACAVIAICLALIALVRETIDEKHMMQGGRERVARVFKEQELESLSGAPAWIDKEKGKVGIPIERAMSLVTDEIAKDPAAATPPTPAAVPSTAPTDSAAPADSAIPANALPLDAPTVEPKKDKKAKKPAAAPAPAPVPAQMQ